MLNRAHFCSCFEQGYTVVNILRETIRENVKVTQKTQRTVNSNFLRLRFFLNPT